VSIERKIKQRKQRRASRVRSTVAKTGVPRLSVFRSLKQISAQLIDDSQHKTLCSSSSLEHKDLKGDKKAIAKAVGLRLAEKAKKLGIDKAVFDRGSYLYHGRVQALAEGAREGGLTI